MDENDCTDDCTSCTVESQICFNREDGKYEYCIEKEHVEVDSKTNKKIVLCKSNQNYTLLLKWSLMIIF